MTMSISPSKDNNSVSLPSKSVESGGRSLHESGDVKDSLKKIQVTFRLSPSEKLNGTEKIHFSDLDDIIAGTSSLSIREEKELVGQKCHSIDEFLEVRKDKVENEHFAKESDTSQTPSFRKSVKSVSPSHRRNDTSSRSSTGMETIVTRKEGTVDTDMSINVTNEAKKLLAHARLLFEEGKVAESLHALEEAYSIDPLPKTARKIVRLKEILDTDRETDTEEKAEAARNAAAELDTKARALFQVEDYHGTLQLLLRADTLCPSDKFKRRIKRLRDLIAEIEEEENNLRDEKENVDDDIADLTRDAANLSLKTSDSPDADVVELTEDFFLPRSIHKKLYPYQRDGVSWLWNLHKTAPGGILADDMGLGKTLQTIAFLTGYFLSQARTKKPQTALILAPVSVLETWRSEFAKWSPSMRLFTYYELAKNARQRALFSVQSRGGILLTTYNMLVSGIQDIASDHNSQNNSPPWLSSTTLHPPVRAFTYDYLILDEAHRIKNPSTQIAKAVRTINCCHRLLLTGTAVQNNLRELWSLFDFTHTGRLLGSQKTFLLQYEKPILRSRERDASAAERLHGSLMAESLNKMIRPFLLRRTKQDTLTVVAENSMPRKNEIVVWIYLSPLQEKIYRNFLRLDHVKALLFGGTTRRSPLVELTILKKLCDHPRLLSTDQCANLGLDVSKVLPGSEIRAPSHDALVQESGKLDFLVRLLELFQEEAFRNGTPAHRTLVFSQSLRLLNMAEAAILGINEKPGRSPKLGRHRVLRLDGRLKKLEERKVVLKQFDEDLSYTALLLTTQVGGVGLTITSADRVVILDPSWNPSIDAQAVDRVYRIGQHSNVVVYRLITCATVEEKIYRRQVFKDSVIRQTIGQAAADRPADTEFTDPYRYFTRQELVELFSLDKDSHFSSTQRQLADLHDNTEHQIYPELESNLAFVKSMTDVVFDISYHDLLFSRKEDRKNEEENVAERMFAENRLKLGEAALKLETAGNLEESTRVQRNEFIPSKPTYNHPAGDFFIPSKKDSKRPMFNAPGCGMHKFSDRDKSAEEIYSNSSEINPTTGPQRIDQKEKEEFSPYSMFQPHVPLLETSSYSSTTNTTSESTDDTEIDETMNRLSFRKSPVVPEIFLTDRTESPIETGGKTRDIVIEDSCCEDVDDREEGHQKTYTAETLSDSLEIIEASFLEEE